MTINILPTPELTYIILGLLTLAAAVQLIFYLAYYMHPLRHMRAEQEGRVHRSDARPPVSVIVYANNESESLRRNLDAFLTQEYPEFEVIVVNDGSSDESEQVLSDFQERYANLYHTFVAEGARNLSRRKLALTLGIKAAKHDVVLLTNANCHPASPRWIETVARNFTDKTQLVVGHTRFERQSGPGQRFIAFDLLLRSLRIYGYTLSHTPYVADGSNLAYRKSLFFENKGFAKYMHLHIGDDDLFVNQVATRRNTKLELAPESHMIATYERNAEGWRYLKRCSAFTASFVRSGAKWLFPVETWSRYLFYAASLLLVALALVPPINVALLATAITAIVVRLVLTALFWSVASRRLASRRLTLSPWLYELLTPVADLLFHASSRFNRKRNFTWKM